MHKFFALNIAPEKNCQPKTVQEPMKDADDETSAQLQQTVRAGESLKTT